MQSQSQQSKGLNKSIDIGVEPQSITACQQLLQKVMLKAKLTKAELSRELGFSSSRYIIQILAGVRLIPGHHVKKLSQLSGIAEDKFLKAWLSDKRYQYLAEIQTGEI